PQGPGLAIPFPGVAQFTAGILAVTAAEENRDAALAVVGHAVPCTRRRAIGRAKHPSNAIPFPGVGQKNGPAAATILPAEQHGYAAACVIGHGVRSAGAGPWDSPLRPACSVPLPRVVVLARSKADSERSAEQDRNATQAIVGHGGTAAAVRAGGGAEQPG